MTLRPTSSSKAKVSTKSWELHREADQLRQAKMQEEARLKDQKHQGLIAENLEKMSKMERGIEDSCKRITNQSYVISLDPDDSGIKCQFGGEVTLKGLTSAGWLVVSKTKDKEGMVTDYFIRKAR